MSEAYPCPTRVGHRHRHSTILAVSVLLSWGVFLLKKHRRFLYINLLTWCLFIYPQDFLNCVTILKLARLKIVESSAKKRWLIDGQWRLARTPFSWPSFSALRRRAVRSSAQIRNWFPQNWFSARLNIYSPHVLETFWLVFGLWKTDTCQWFEQFWAVIKWDRRTWVSTDGRTCIIKELVGIAI